MRVLSRFLPRRFRAQISFLVILMATIGIALFAGYMARQQGNLITQTLENTGNVLSQNLAFDAAKLLIEQDYASLELVVRQYASLPDIVSVRVTNPEGLALIQVNHEANQVNAVYNFTPFELPDSLKTQENPAIKVLKESHELIIWRPIVAGPTRLGFVELRLSLRSSLLIQGQVYKNTFSFGTVAVLLALLFLLLYLRRPIEAMQRASEFVSQLDLKKGQVLEVAFFAQEFETLTRSLNLVSQRLYSKEQEAQSSQMRLEATLLHSVDGIITLDEDLRISSANPAVERLFGYTLSALLAKPWEFLFDQEGTQRLDLGLHRDQDQALMARHKKGFFFPVSFASSQLKVAGATFYSLRIHDMTERYAYEKALREREAEARKLSLVASRTNNAVVITNAKGQIEWVNEGFTRITEYTLEEIKGKKPGEILQGPETNRESIKHLSQDLKQYKSAHAELLNYSKSGRKYWIDLEIKPVFDEQGLVSNFMAIESDITERKEAAFALELALKEAESANQAKSEFLSRISHELRTPLNAILGFGQLLEFETLSSRQKESVDHILVAGRHLLELIDEILDISRIETGQIKLLPEAVNLNKLLEDVLVFVAPMAREQAVSFHLNIPESTTIWVDSKRFRQVVLNLFSNSIKYNHEGGKVFVRFKEQEGGRFQLIVQDTGLGIANSKLSRLFTPFDRLDAEALGIEGTGIGLALSKSLIESMGGEIRVESQEGIGSSFVLDLPGYKAPSIEAPYANYVARRKDEVGKAGFDLLYMEDNPSNIALVEAVVAMRPNLSLRVAQTAQAGLERLQEKLPDVLLLDLHLPDRDGQEVLAELKARELELPVLVLSADVTATRLAELEQMGLEGFIAKPIQLKELLRHIDRLTKVPELELNVF